MRHDVLHRAERGLAALLVCWGTVVGADAPTLRLPSREQGGLTLAPQVMADGGVKVLIGVPERVDGGSAVYEMSVHGPDAWTLGAPLHADPGSTALGSTLVTCDVDGDGLLDEIVGAPGTAPAGAIQIYRQGQSQPDPILRPNAILSRFGSRLACLSAGPSGEPAWLLVGGDEPLEPIASYVFSSGSFSLRGLLTHDTGGGCGGGIALVRGPSGGARALTGCPYDARLRVDDLDPATQLGAPLTDGTFLPSTEAGFGTLVQAIGDFDGDGQQDYAVASVEKVFICTTVSATPPLYASMNKPVVGLSAIGDVNGDGYADVAYSARDTATSASMVVSGRPATATSAPHDLTVQLSTASVFAPLGDNDGDGLGDYVAGSPSDGSLLWGTGSSGGPGVAGQSVPGPGNATRAVAVGDVDGDGFADVLWQTDGVEHHLYRGGPGGLQDSGASIRLPDEWARAGLVAAAAGDLNGDGYADIAFGLPEANGVAVFYGMPAFTTPWARAWLPAPTGVSSHGRHLLAAGDLDGDGYDDLAVFGQLATATGGAETVFVYRGGVGGPSGVPAWQRGPRSDGAAFTSMGAAGLAGDGPRGSLLLAWNNELTMCSVGPSGGIDVTWTMERSDTQVVGSFDFDGDGHGEILLRDATGPVLCSTPLEPSPGCVPRPLPGGTLVDLAVAGDVTGLGRTSLLVATSNGAGTTQYVAYEPSGGTNWSWSSQWSRHEVGGQSRLLATGDVNGDGADDVGLDGFGSPPSLLRIDFGGNDGPQRRFGLTQRLDGAARGQGYVQTLGAGTENVRFEGEVRDEIAARGPLRLEVQAVKAGEPWSQARVGFSSPMSAGRAHVDIPLGPGAWRWRARVASSSGLVGRWRPFGAPQRAAFTLTQESDGGVSPDGGVMPSDGGEARLDAGAVSSDGGASFDGGGVLPDGGVVSRFDFDARGCACGAGGGGLSTLLLLLALGLRRRRARVTPRRPC